MLPGFTFLKQFIFTPRNVGAVAPSSRVLARVITETAGVSKANAVVEFGPGTGVVTEVIARQLPRDSHFIAIEVNPTFVDMVRRRCPDVNVVHDSAANAKKHLAALGLDHCDCVISGLPWASFDGELQDALLDATLEILKPGGRFVAFTYIESPLLPGGKRFKRRLDELFQDIGKTPVVWRNFPPAFVYYARK